LIESQQISSELVAPTVTGFAAERIEIIKQRVMTHENLSRIINKYKLFNNGNLKLVTSEQIDKLRENINVEIIRNEFNTRHRNTANIAFTISFQYRYPKIAYQVTNELVTLFLDENIKSRVERATETTEFLKQEAKRLKEELEKVESQVATFKQENADALPEHLGLKMEMLERTQRTLADLDRDYKAREVELKRLQLDLAAERSSGTGGGNTLTELEELKTEYKRATLLYKESHPTVRQLKHKIDALNKAAKNEGKNTGTERQIHNTLLASRIQTMINTTKSELVSIEEQRKPLRERISQLQEQIIRTPQVESGLSSLLCDHGNAQEKYEEIQQKELSAQIAENLEGEKKSERFILIDPPLLADKPTKPDRLKLLLVGIFLAIGSGIGSAILIEALNQRVYGKAALSLILGYEPIVEIPYIKTEEEIKSKQNFRQRIAVISVSILLALLILIHVLYMDLDVLFYKILARF
jgi:polysaccharide chain length determinant protein (PEP-CTERM system associated)